MSTDKTIFVGIGEDTEKFQSLSTVSGQLQPEHPVTYLITQNITANHARRLIDFIKTELQLSVRHLNDPAAFKPTEHSDNQDEPVMDEMSLFFLEQRLMATRQNLQQKLNQTKNDKTELQSAYEQLSEQSHAYTALANELENILRSLNTPLIVVDESMRIKRLVPAAEALFSINQSYINRSIESIDLLASSDVENAIQATLNHAKINTQLLNTGDKIWHLQTTPKIENGSVTGAILIFFDSTELFQTQAKARKEQQRHQITLESVADGIIRMNMDGFIEYINPAAAELLGWTTKDAIGRPVDKVIEFVNSDEQALLHRQLSLKGQPPASTQCQHTGKLDVSCVEVINKHGEHIHIHYKSSITTNRHNKPDGTVIAFHDMTEHQKSLDKMRWMSSHDELTGIPNRREIEVQIRARIDHFENISAFLYMDLDQFKVVNDTCGHMAGDKLLKQISHLLTESIDGEGILARLGGDEFGLLIDECIVDKALNIAEKIRTVLENFRFSWQGNVFRVGISIGIVEITAQTSSVEEVLSHADSACYAAKELGRDRIHVYQYNDEFLEQQRRDLSWVKSLQRSIDEDELILYAQKIMPLDNSAPEHWEILLRIGKENGEIVLPNTFLPAAERYGMMQKLDEWVVDKVFNFLSVHAAQGVQLPYVNINLSGASFTDDRLIVYIRKWLKNSDIDAKKIVFEITESSAIGNLSTAIQFIDEVRALGCKVALDDFGTGMSSFSYLQKLKVDCIKIDGNFIRDIHTNEFNEKIVRSIVDLSSHLNISTVAEYVENQSILEKIKDIGIDWAQGYAVGQPVPARILISESTQYT